MSEIKGIHHVALKARGEEEFLRVCAFYNDILGLKTVRRWVSGGGSAVMVAAGESMLEIFANAPDRPESGAYRHLAFAVDDVDSIIERVRKAGFEITMQPTDLTIPSEPPYPARIAFCRGVLGEEIEFFCER